MTCVCQCLWFLLLTIELAWSLNPSEYGFYWKALDDPYGRRFSPFGDTAAAPGHPMNGREFSLQMAQTNKFGLPKCANQQNKCRKIGIVGAGAAGLYCGILLAEAGHTVTISEASDRAGGRVFTYRDPRNPTMYMGDFGAMRFPLDAQPYLNTLIRQRYKLNLREFVNSNENGYVYINGIYARFKDVRANPDIFKFNTSQNERGKTVDALWTDAIEPVFQSLERGGWLSVRNQWDSYSMDSYLNTRNLSRAAIDYINAYRDYETYSYTSIATAVRSTLLSGAGSKYYHIEGGNDLLIHAMVAECQAIESNRCSIVSSTPITEIQLYNSSQVRWTTKNGTSDVFDLIIVATSATASQLIDFDRRIDFVEKCRALRQLHYLCASKILLFFNVSWWYTQENLNGGQSITDLNLRNIYYPRTDNNETNGGTIIASYSVGYNALLWQSLSESDAIEIALKQMIQLHRSSSNMRDYFQGGKVQHWCGDPYVCGAFARLTPYQETNLFAQLQAPVSNVHFIGEHTSLIHGWVEGALVSALRAALVITAQGESIFDVIIVGGSPVGLITAVLLSLKHPGLRIGIVDRGIILNSNRSSGTLEKREFRQMYEEEYLAELSNMSFSLWRQFEELANMSLGSILNIDDGFLFFADLNTSRSTVEGNFVSIKRNCENVQMGCEYLNNTQLRTRYPMLTFPSQYGGIFHNQSGYINLTTLMIGLFRIIDQNPNIIIRQQEEFLLFELFDNQTQIVTDRGVLYASRRVLFIPGPYVNNISRLLNVDLSVALWEQTVFYFRRLPTVTQLPNWLTLGDHNEHSIFSGFSIDSTSDYIVVEPRFIRNLSNSLVYPSQQTNTIDPFVTEKVLEWVSRHMGTLVNVSDYYQDNHTHLVTYPPGNGLVLDYVPRTNKRLLIHTVKPGLTLAPIWADILSDMILFETNSTSKYGKYLHHFSLSQPNRLIDEVLIRNKGYQPTFSVSIFCCLASLLY